MKTISSINKFLPLYDNEPQTKVVKYKSTKKNKRTQLGIFYTPDHISLLIKELCISYIKENTIVLDPAAGCGDIIKFFKDYDYRIADIDEEALRFLHTKFDAKNIFNVNMLEKPTRSEYLISPESSLIIVSNPPYNDLTSLYSKNKKGQVLINADIFDRDLGIAFLKAMSMLSANFICVLHPLSYLIKKSNFNRLKRFFNNYVLKDAFVFPSFVFKNVSKNVGFPIVLALYERGKNFTTEMLLDFPFKILWSHNFFRLKEICTTDNMIYKYPIKGTSPLGLYFHTFRDINSIIRNKDFLLKPTNQTIPLDEHNFEMYCYLVSLKHYIKENGQQKFWFYGNFSPLINPPLFKENKHFFVAYALQKVSLPSNVKQDLYKIFSVDCMDLSFVEEYFDKLFTYKNIT